MIALTDALALLSPHDDLSSYPDCDNVIAGWAITIRLLLGTSSFLIFPCHSSSYFPCLFLGGEAEMLAYIKSNPELAQKAGSAAIRVAQSNPELAMQASSAQLIHCGTEYD